MFPIGKGRNLQILLIVKVCDGVYLPFSGTENN